MAKVQDNFLKAENSGVAPFFGHIRVQGLGASENSVPLEMMTDF